MAKILGIIPQYPEHTQNNIFSKVLMPPIGIVSVLTNMKGHETACIDENNYSGPLDYMGQPDHKFLYDEIRPDVIFLYGGMTNAILRGYAIAKTYKKLGCIIVAGGSHVDALPEEALSKGIDYVAHGEGEESALELLDAIKNKKDVRKIRGLSFMHGKRYVFTGKRTPIKDPDKFRVPDLRIIRYLRKRFSAIPVSWGVGCPYNCEFCVVNNQYGDYKARSIEKVMEQIIMYSDLGFKKFFFTNDNFAHNIEETKKLCKTIGDYKRKFKKKISLIVQVRTEVAERDDLLEAMKYGGVEMLAIGYESPINEELAAMRKGVTYEKLVKRSRKLSQFFYLHGMFIFGYPGSRKSRMTLKERGRRYRKFFSDARIDSIQVFKAIPIPGTDLRARLEREGTLLPLEVVNWDKYDGLFLCYDPRPDGYDPYELQNIPNNLMKMKYSGDFIDKTINYGNWMNWVYNTLGFPIYFSLDYIRQLLFNLLNRRRALKVNQAEQLLPRQNLFQRTLQAVWMDIKRQWRNLAIRNIAGGMVRRWHRTYKRNDYQLRLKRFFSRKTAKSI